MVQQHIDLSVTPCVAEDLPTVAAIHKKEMSTHFLGRYPESLLRQFYACFIEDCNFLVSRGPAVNGFVVGGTASAIHRSMNRFITTARNSYLWETAIRPWLYVPAIKRLTRVRPYLASQGRVIENDDADRVSISSIAVDSSARGQGIGATLLRAFEERLLPNSIYYLSVKRDNHVAINFYLKNGFHIDREKGDGLYLSKAVVRGSSK